jgi:hypothetical protein
MMVPAPFLARPSVLAAGSSAPAGSQEAGASKGAGQVEEAIREHLSAGHGILKVAAMVGVGSGTVQRIRKEMAAQIAEAA